MEEFTNRDSQYINRRKLTIVSQAPNEMVVDIAREDGEVEVVGSSIDASTMNEFLSEVNTAVNTASLALSKANDSDTKATEAKSIANSTQSYLEEIKTTANSALDKSTEAKTTANSASLTASEAKTLADTAKTLADTANADILTLNQRVSTAENTLDNKCTVTVGENKVTTLNFTSDPQTQLNNKADLALLNSEISARQNLETQVGTKVAQTEFDSEITNRQNADSAILAKFNNLASGVVTINDNESAISVVTGLNDVSTFVPILKLGASASIARNITIDSISGGTVVINLRNANTGVLEGIANASELDAKIYWFAMKSFN